MNDQYDGDDRESRTAFRAYDTLSEPVSGRTPWQIWRDACAWQASRATPADQEPIYMISPALHSGHWIETDAEHYKDYTDDYRRIVYAQPPQPEAQSVRDAWISVDERLPEDQVDVLVRCEYGIGEYWDIAGIFYGEWESHITESACRRRVTHWQPLPAPPHKPVSED